MFRFYDFFAGAGLATLGLRHAWECVWANDVDIKKGRVYKSNFGPDHFHSGDVASYTAKDLPNSSHLAWASFPCQDLSLAGWRRGISADRSGVFWAFWKIMRGQLVTGGRPGLIVIENVTGVLYGDSFTGLCEALAVLGMQFGALVIDARYFLPQSRARVFIVAVDSRLDCGELATNAPVPEWTTRALMDAYSVLNSDLRKMWRWWKLPVPRAKRPSLSTIIEKDPTGVVWHSRKDTAYLLSLMSSKNLSKIRECQKSGDRHIGFLYKRIRQGVQRAEVRFDGVSGCLRTPRGGSSRQTVVIVEKGKVRSRLLSPREAARLMGAPDSFRLPEKYNDAYKAMGDAVVVPVVRWLSEYLLEPLADAAARELEGNGKHDHVLLDSVERRASDWTHEKRRMESKELVDKSLAALSNWHKRRDEIKGTASDSFIACAGLKVAELSRKKWPIQRADLVGKGGRFRSTGQFVQRVLSRFGEDRLYASEGGRTTGGSIEAAEDLVAELDQVDGYPQASFEEKSAVADAIQRWLYDNAIKPNLDCEGVKVEINLEKLPPDIIGDILDAAAKRGVSGAVAQHLVGAKLALRYPNMDIENYGHTTQDKILGREGDFAVNDTIFHVTMSPGEAVVEKCSNCVHQGYQPMLLVPRSEIEGAKHFIKKSKYPKRIWLTSIEDFVAQNVAEIGEFGKGSLKGSMKALLEKYNERAGKVEAKRSALIKIPENL